MKLATCKYNQKIIIGAVVGNHIVPFDLQGSTNMMQFLAGGPANQDKLQKKIDAGSDRIALTDIVLLAPIPRPGK